MAVSRMQAAVFWLLEDLAVACGFPEWGHWGTEGAPGPWVWRAALRPGCWLELPRIWLRYHLLTMALGK